MRILNLILCFSVTLLTINCAGVREPMPEPISVDFNGTVSSLSKVVKSIELVQLENDDEHLLGTMVDLIVTEDSYVSLMAKMVLYSDTLLMAALSIASASVGMDRKNMSI